MNGVETMPEYIPLAIMAGGKTVGSLTYGMDSQDGLYWIRRLPASHLTKTGK